MIEAKEAGLALKSVAVLNSHMEVLGEFDGGIVDMKTDVNVKFAQNKEDENKKMVRINAVVSSRVGQGYHIEIDIICQFDCTNSDEVNNYTAMLYISIPKLREAVTQLTLFGVHGIYTMPLIDTYDLYNKIVKDFKDIEPLSEREDK